jgi:hypothetical protein
MSVDRRHANLQKLKEADEIQQKTKEAVERITRQAAATEEIAITSLEELRKQGQQMDEINKDLEDVSSKLDTSQALQNRFDRWAGNWLGGKKRAAIREAHKELESRSEEGLSSIKEVYENEKYDSIARTWRPVSLVLVSDPTKEANIFDPVEQVKSADSPWLIDYSLSGVDAEGWTYAKDLNQLINRGCVPPYHLLCVPIDCYLLLSVRGRFGEAVPRWNSYVRRRKWRHVDKTSEASGALAE